MTSREMSGGWTAALADLLRRGTSELRDADLQSLAASYKSDNPATDQTRQTILQLLAKRQSQSLSRPSRPIDIAPLAIWPGETPSPLPPFHVSGLKGISLISVSHNDAETVAASLSTWLKLPVDEIVVVDLSPMPLLEAQLADHGPSGPRLRIVRLSGSDLSPAQALNVGLRLARHQRMLVAAAAVQFGPDYLTMPALTAGEFRVDPGAADGSSFALDVDRSDLAAVGGFNEYLGSADYGIDELSARLMAHGVRPVPFAKGQIKRPPFPDPVAFGTGDLRAALQGCPEFAAHRNRFIAAIMPDWTGTKSRDFGLVDRSDRVLTLRPLSPDAPKATPKMQAEAEFHAMIDLVARHVGGTPTTLDARRLDILLSAPSVDVCAFDVAVAASARPELVGSRRAWLVIDVDAAVLPIEGTKAHTAFQSIVALADRQGMTIVLTLPEGIRAEDLPILAHYPVISADPDLRPGVRALALRDLQADPAVWLLPHSTLAFDTQTLADHAALSVGGPAILLRRPKIFVDAQHGLGNRLRAIASAGAIATHTGRELVIIWQPDDHCDCRYEDLFEPGGAVLDQGFHDDPAIKGIDLFNYMEVEPGSAKDQPITLSSFRDTYVRSAYPLISPFSNWDKENTWLRLLRPNAVVLDLAASVRSPNALSLHIRMEGGVAAQHLAYESSGNWTEAAHLEIDHWRKRSHFSYFFPRLDQLIAEGLADTVFLATDTPAVYDAFSERYGNRIASLPRPATDRSASALTYALADMLLLSRAPRLLGSTWSSFSELAARLGDPMVVELSGRDF